MSGAAAAAAGGLQVHQLLSGRDFAVDDHFASQMRNFVYVISDEVTRKAVVVDPAYDLQGILAFLDCAELELTAAIATHHHADHVGGSIFGNLITGISELLRVVEVPVHVADLERTEIAEQTGVDRSALVPHHSGDELSIGALSATLIHTPGHTRGSQCVLVEGMLVTGDTLFLSGCGRTDLPGGDAKELYHSLHDRLSPLADETLVLPGHAYSSQPSAALGLLRRTNPVLTEKNERQWMEKYGN